jgi:hypothetical protein
MVILTVTSKGTIHLPAETLAKLKGARHLKLRQNAGCITLTPVTIGDAAERYAIPETPTANDASTSRDASRLPPNRQI